METKDAFEGWAIVELMGHRRLAGYVREVEIAGQGMLRLDVPGWIHTEPTGEQEERGAATQFYSPNALYCLTPTTEDIARRFAARTRPAPVSRFELPAAPVEEPPLQDEEPEFEHAAVADIPWAEDVA